MTLRNPWIDPRVARVRSAAIESYLLRGGWIRIPETESAFHEYEASLPNTDAPVLRVPLREQGRDYVQRVIELITDLALTEQRPAVAVLDDILETSTTNGVSGSPVKTVPTTP